MINPTMLYKKGTMLNLRNIGIVDYITVSEDDIEEYLDNEWFASPQEAISSENLKDTKDDRKQILKKADNLGIKYPAQIRTATLEKLIEDKLNELD